MCRRGGFGEGRPDWSWSFLLKTRWKLPGTPVEEHMKWVHSQGAKKRWTNRGLTPLLCP
jgi:hypothetical protein